MDRKRPPQGGRLADGDLVAIGYAGLAGTACLVRQKREALLSWFSSPYLDHILTLAADCEEIRWECGKTAKEREVHTCVVCSGEILRGAASPGQRASASGVTAADEGQGLTVWPAAEGGILKAIWDFSETGKFGVDFALRRIPIRQETVEVCERLGLNPYRLYSRGCGLAAVANGGRVVRELAAGGIPAAVIGTVTEAFVRRMTVENGSGFLERPRPDEMWKVLSTEPACVPHGRD